MKILSEMLVSMPDIEERRKSFFFKKLVPLFKMSATDDYHWILYACLRITAIVSLAFALVTIFYLSSKAEALNEDIVTPALRFFTVGESTVILLAIIPYYYFKVKVVVGFSKIDFLEAFPENRKRVPRFGWAFDRSKIIKNTRLLCLGMYVCLIFSWTSMVMIINHYEAITSLVFISIFTFIYSIIVTPALTFLVLLSLMGYKQYKDYFDQMPKDKFSQGSKK